MNGPWDELPRIRRWLAATIGPELVALFLTVVVVIVLVVVALAKAP